MEFELEPTFRRRLEKKSPEMQGAILRALAKLEEDRRRSGLRVRRLRGDVWYAKINEGDRLTFEFHGETVRLLNHCTHDWMKRTY